MADRKMCLLAHIGTEHSVDFGQSIQSLGNPLLLRFPLEKGVRVIAAHCATEGTNQDLDDPQKPIKSNFELWLRMMEEERFSDLLFADISSVTMAPRVPALGPLLDQTHLHHRFVNGSDYPLPAINIAVHTNLLERKGFINFQERNWLNEIYGMNPLLFDFCLKRLIRSPTRQSKFAPSVFGVPLGLHDLLTPIDYHGEAQKKEVLIGPGGI